MRRWDGHAVPDVKRAADAVRVPRPGTPAERAARALSAAAGNTAAASVLAVQRTLKKGAAGSKADAKAVMKPEKAAVPVEIDSTRTRADLSGEVRTWIHQFCEANGSNRFSESHEVAFTEGNVKVEGTSRAKVTGAATLAFEVDLRGAAHNEVATPHVKIWSKFGADKSLQNVFSPKVYAVSAGDVETILAGNTLPAAFVNRWRDEVQKYYTFKNYGRTYTP